MVKEKEKKSGVTDEADEPTAIDRNLRFYSQGCTVPADALKEIRAGRLKGMSDVNPMWRMKRMTEIFGPVGFGWKYTIDKFWTECYGEEVKCYCTVSLYVRDPETKEWSEAIPGTGGSAIVSKESKGPYVNDEGYKMALTDALSIAMKPLGIGGNIWYGPKATGHNESKYEAATRESYAPASTLAYSGAQLHQALSELANVKTEGEFGTVWKKWQKQAPALCMNGTEFYNKSSEKIAQIRSSNIGQ